MRSGGGKEHWRETKKSIKDARYRLSIQRNSLNIGSEIQLRSKSKSLPGDVMSEVNSNVKLGTTFQGLGQKIYFDMNGLETGQLPHLRSGPVAGLGGHRNLVYIEDSHLDQVING